MSLGTFRVALDEFAAGGNPLHSDGRPFGVIRGKLAAIKRSLGELPGGNVIGRFGLVKLLRRDKNFLCMTEQLSPARGVRIRSCVADREQDKRDRETGQNDSPQASGLNLNDGINSCGHAPGIYTLIPVTLQRKTLRLLMVAALLGLTAGCSGIHASKSVSPLDFLIPGGGGLMRGLLFVPPPPPCPASPDAPVPANQTQVV